MIANWLISRVTNVELHDYGCSLKAYRAHVIKSIHAYGDMHRFFPAVASLAGAKTAEVIVRHHSRKYGISKYGLERTFKVLADLISIHLITKFSAKPMRYFGALAAMCVGASIIPLAGMVMCARQQSMVTCAGAAMLLVLLGVHFLMLGLICMLVVNRGKYDSSKLSFETAQVF